MTTISTRPLGKTGLEISELGLGGVFLKRRPGAPWHDSVDVVHRALELGVNYIDTAPLYGNSQEVLGEALEGRKEQYILGTKCGRWSWQDGPFRDLGAFKSQFEQSLKLLRRDAVDILYIHEADWAAHWKDMTLPREQFALKLDDVVDYESAPVAQFLRWAKQQNMTRFLGISGNNAHLLAKVMREIPLQIDVLLVAFQYSLIWRNAPKYVLPVAKEMGMGVILGAPLQQGRLSAPNPEWIENPPDWMDEETRRRFADLYEIQRETGLTLPELTIRFLLADPDFTSVIPGAGTVRELEENVDSAAADPLPADLHARIEALGKVFPSIIE